MKDKEKKKDRLYLEVTRLIFAVFVFPPLKAVLTMILAIILLPIKINKLFLLAFKKNSARIKEHALSITYLNQTAKKSLKFKLILFLCSGFFFILDWKFPQINLSIISIVLLALLILLIAKELLIAYRIRKGFFGTNRTEARALIEFLIKNSEDIDFTDSNGNLRRALLPEAEPTTAEQPLPAFGEEASA
ncbi:MAG: hypothetical protein D3911_00585 [Candidatus Electrothrix sp. AW3_4]|nr:hypothetical protein [Candidatus Electrothrix gigas]